VWSFKAQIIVNVVVVVAVQSLYALRLWRLNGSYQKRWYPKLVPFAILLGTAVGIALAVESFRLRRFSQLERMKWATYSSFATTVAVDTCIAVAIICYLRDSRTVYNGTNNTLTALVLWVMSTGAATSLCALLALIMYACMPQKLAFLAVEFLLSKLYVNSFLAFLNARNHIREKTSAVVTIDGTRSQSSPGIILATMSKSDAPSHPAGYMEGKSIPAYVVDANVHTHV